MLCKRLGIRDVDDLLAIFEYNSDYGEIDAINFSDVNFRHLVAHIIEDPCDLITDEVFCCVSIRCPELIPLFLSLGADPNASDLTTLGPFAYSYTVSGCRMFLEAGADVSIRDDSYWKQNCLEHNVELIGVGRYGVLIEYTFSTTLMIEVGLG